MIKFAFTYKDNFTHDINSEVNVDWSEFWDYERSGEITILSIDQSSDNWETCTTIYEADF